MANLQWSIKTALLAVGAFALVAGCGNATNLPLATPPMLTAPVTESPPRAGSPAPANPGAPAPKPAGAGTARDGVKVAPKPDDLAVLVNKRIMLPDGYVPSDLVEPNIPFIFTEHVEKRLMRKEAAGALERLFAAAKQDGIHLAGVSGYRSYTTQKSLFEYYVRVQGEETARKYSAEPGHSEHQTGLAMDVSGSTGKCAADDCFADTPEAKWLAGHAAAHGFIIRYPKGKESVTGYSYEPWHLRYVGAALSAQVAGKGVTLEEYFGVAG